VLVSIAMRGAFAEVATTFEKQTGDTVKIIAAAPGEIVASLKEGAPARRDRADRQRAAGDGGQGTHLAWARRACHDRLRHRHTKRRFRSDIATPHALKAAPLGTAMVIYNDPAITSSGKFLLTIAERLGIAEQVIGAVVFRLARLAS